MTLETAPAVKSSVLRAMDDRKRPSDTVDTHPSKRQAIDTSMEPENMTFGGIESPWRFDLDVGAFCSLQCSALTRSA